MHSVARTTLAVVLVAAAPLALAQGVSEQISHGQINWDERVIVVTGSAAPSASAANAAEARLGAERAAKLDAWRNILEALKGVKISAGTTVGSKLDSSPAVMAKVQGLLRNFKVLDTKYYSDGGVDVIVKMPLDGVLLETIAPQDKTTQVPSSGPAEFTGLVINAKGLSLRPALLPRVLDQEGKEVYAAHMLTPKDFHDNGVAAYTSDLDAALKHQRAGGKPLVIKASAAAGDDRTDLVIAGADAARLRDSAKNLSFLAQGRVLIVVD